MVGSAPRLCVLVAAGRAAWEPDALRMLADAGIVVLRRCVDLPDLLGAASAGSADLALVDADLPGLDADAVHRLHRYDVRVLAIVPPDSPLEADRLARIGAATLGDVAALPAAIESLVAAPAPAVVTSADPADAAPSGRVVAVWGPTGAPGRTTVAVGLAAEHAAGGDDVVLVDADPYGGAVAQHLGVLDEVSGMLAAARLANQGALDADGLLRCRRSVGDRFEVLTGLPRPDRWIEVRPGVLETVVDIASRSADVIVDCGFSVEEAEHAAPGRNVTTLEALGVADRVVLVGSAEPTGLTRLARALVDLGDAVPEVPTTVVVNRMRDTLGWRRQDIVGMVEGYAREVDVRFLPEDREAVDRALVAGRSLTETGDSPLRRALHDLADEVLGAPARGDAS